jgi:hypothetical protein
LASAKKETDMAATTYEYKFVKIELKQGLSAAKPREDYHEIIQNLSKEGWRLVQVFAPWTAGLWVAAYFELIFERPRE